MSQLTHTHLPLARLRLRGRGVAWLIGLALLVAVLIAGVVVLVSESSERFAPALGYPASPYAGGPDEAARGNAVAAAVGAPTAPPTGGTRGGD
jgi:hypothetical protein